MRLLQDKLNPSPIPPVVRALLCTLPLLSASTVELSYPYSSFLSSSSFLGSKLSCTISDILVCGGAFTYRITVIELILIESILVSQGSDIDIWG